MRFEEMTKNQLISFLSNQSRYGEVLVECLDKYKKNSTAEITREELVEFCKEKENE